MERKEIFAVILAIVCVVLVIGVMGMMRGNPDQEESLPDVTEMIQITSTTVATDIWDVIHDQHTTTTEVTEVTDEEGNLITEPEDGTGMADPDSAQPDAELPPDDAVSSETVVVTTAPEELVPGGYTLFVTD